MNKDRRNKPQTLVSKLEEIRAELEGITQEEMDYYVNMPDSLKDSERGQASEVASSELESAEYSLGEAISSIESAIG